MKVHQLPTAPQKVIRLAQCQLLLLLLNELSHWLHPPLQGQEDLRGQQQDQALNDRWLCQDPEDAPVKLTMQRYVRLYAFHHPCRHESEACRLLGGAKMRELVRITRSPRNSGLRDAPSAVVKRNLSSDHLALAHRLKLPFK